MKLALFAMVIATGMLMPFQAGQNAEFRRAAGHPLFAAILNFAVGLIVLLLVMLVAKVSKPNANQLAAAPWWAWCGGFCGAALVLASIVAAPRMGALSLVGGLIAGQLGASLIVDHFGLVGYAVRPITLSRLIGIGLLWLGIFLVHRGS